MIDRKHIYRVYTSAGDYIGLLPSVKSDFQYYQDVNTGSVELEIRVAQTIDTAPEDVEVLTDETGETLTDEVNDTLVTEQSATIFGESNGNYLIANDNIIKVYEVSEEYPNGVLVFDGYISTWSGKISGSDDIKVTCLSLGKDMSDYIYGNGVFTAEVTQAASSSALDYGRVGQAPGGSHIGGNIIDQVGTTLSGHNFTLSKIGIHMARGNHVLGVFPSSVIATLKIYEGPFGSGFLLDTVNAFIQSQYPTFEEVAFILNNPIVLSPAGSYWFTVILNDYAEIAFQGSNVYGGGSIFYGTTASGYFLDGSLDLKFRLFSGGVATEAVFAAYDPAQMVRDAIDGVGSAVGYDALSIEDTDTVVDYTFSLATLLEVVEKARELSPANTYWYVDPATQLLYFRQYSTTADHQFVLGKHVEDFEIEVSKEHIKNVVYFTGGPTAGVNLLKLYSDSDSLALNRRGMARLTDNRIIAANEPAARVLSESFMDENSNEQHSGSISILAADYDIDSINPGDTCSFQGTSGFMNNLVFRITRLYRRTDRVELNLGKIPFRQEAFVDKIKRDLEKQQTLDNPSAPS